MSTYTSISIDSNGEFITKDLNLNKTNTPDDNLIIQNELTGFNDDQDGFHIGVDQNGDAIIEMKENKNIIISNNNLTTAKFLSNNSAEIVGDFKCNSLNLDSSILRLNNIFGNSNQVLKINSNGTSLDWANTNWKNDNNINWHNNKVGVNVTSSSNVSRALECRGEILLRSYDVNNVAKASLFYNNADQTSEESFVLFTNSNYTGSGGWGKVIIVRDNRNVGIGALPGATDKLYVNGNIVASGTCCNSDFRIKKNITTANYHDIYNKFKNLRLTEYGYIDEYCKSVGIPNGKVVNGLIAQELKEVYSDLVTVIDKQDIVIDDEKIKSFENFHRIDFTKLVMKLIGVIKVLQNDNEDNKLEINYLKNEIETLEADNKSLNTRIETLESAMDTLINKLYSENILTD